MILDSLLQFDPNPTTVTIAPGTQASTNTIDLGMVSGIPTSAKGGGARDLGVGDDPALKLACCVTVPFIGAGGTLSVSIQGAPDNGSGAPGSWVTYATGNAIGVANLLVGAYLLPTDLPRPPAGAPVPRYLRLLYTVAGGTFTQGSVSAQLVLDRQDWLAYPAGLTISN